MNDTPTHSYGELVPPKCNVGEWVYCDHRLPEPRHWYLVYGCRLKPSEYQKSPEFEANTIHLAFLIQNKWYDQFTAPVYAKYWINIPFAPEGDGRPMEQIHIIIDPLAHIFEKTRGK